MSYTFDLLADPRREPITRLRDGHAPLATYGIVTTADVTVDRITERRTGLQVRIDNDVIVGDAIVHEGKTYSTANMLESPHSNSKSFVLRELAAIPTLVTK